MEERILGTLMLSGVPATLGTHCTASEEIEFCDTEPGYGIPWFQIGRLLVAKRNLCERVTWEQMNELGFISGKPIRIDGQDYLCRSMRGGNAKAQKGEWDDFLNEDPTAWPNTTPFWAQEEVMEYGLHHVVRGGEPITGWTLCPAGYGSGTAIGFRPVLEPITPIPRNIGSMIGDYLSVLGPDNNTIGGLLLAYTDYDLVLHRSTPFHTSCTWATNKEQTVIIDRSKAKWLKGV